MPHAVDRLVPMVFATDVDASIEFYTHLGFEIAHRIVHAGKVDWAWLVAGEANLMLARATDPIEPDRQAILLYLYTSDVRGLRGQLIAKGIPDAGDFRGEPEPEFVKGALFEITTPFYMPDGELRVHDPDGHCLLIGQAHPGEASSGG